MTAVLSLGSDLGDRWAHLAAGVELIGQHLGVAAVSPVYESAAVGEVPDAPAYLNAVVVVDCDDPETVFAAAQAAEAARGRLRPRRHAPRRLDVDVVTVARRRSDEPRLTLPHPAAADRAFVLVPWLDVDPAAVLPGRGPIRQLLAALDASSVRRWPRPLSMP